MKHALAYSFKVWFTALIFTPTLTYLIWNLGNRFLAYTNRNRIFNFGLHYSTDTFKLSNVKWTVLQTTPYYIPYLAMILIATIYFQKNRMRLNKIALSFIAMVLTLYPFAILQVATMYIVFNEKLAWITSFGIFFIAGIWFYKLNTQSMIQSKAE